MNHFLLITSLFLMINLPALAQSTDQGPVREIGFGTSNFAENFTLIYKKELDENRYRRYDASLLLGYNRPINSVNFFEYGQAAFSFRIATEKRNELRDKFRFVHGFFYGLQSSLRFIDNDVDGLVAPSVGYLLGIQYDIHDYWYVGATTFPALRSGFTVEQSSRWGWDLTATFSPVVEVSILYRLI